MRISGSNAGYTTFRVNVRGTGYSMFLLKHNFINVIILVAVPNSEKILHINSFIAESESFLKSV